MAFISSISASDWIDITCAALVLFFAAYDARRGLSATLAQIAALVLSFKLAFVIFPRASAAVGGGIAGAILAAVAAVAVFLLLRYAIAKVAHVILMPPIDNILGALTGAAKALLLLLAAFFAVALGTGKSYSKTPFAKSRAGSRVLPAVERILAPSGEKLPCSLRAR
ncbi:MAG: CvpA family protein [Kiritimatiellae bacterium]|nr:CvpA family protein [Kiritimatiellia bacterium]